MINFSSIFDIQRMVFASNYLNVVIILPVTFKEKTVLQAAAALEVVIHCHFKSKQLICCLIKKR